MESMSMSWPLLFLKMGGGIRGSELLQNLKDTGRLGVFDAPAISIFEENCSDMTFDSMRNASRTFCDVISSEVCQSVETEDLKDCGRRRASPNLNHSFQLIWHLSVYSFKAGYDCLTGVYESVKDILSFVWNILKWVWDKGTHPEEVYQESSEYIESVRLYLATEYDKAYDQASPPWRKMKAVRAVAGQIMEMIFNATQKYLSEEYQAFGCLNVEAKRRLVCQVAGDIFIPYKFLTRGGPKRLRTKFFEGKANLQVMTPERKRMVEALNAGRLPKGDDRYIEYTGIRIIGEKGLLRKDEFDVDRMYGKIVDVKGERMLIQPQRGRRKSIDIDSMIGLGIHPSLDAKKHFQSKSLWWRLRNRARR